MITITAYPTSGLVPLTVQFTSLGVDSAGNTISNWNWNFGDGATSTAQNPPHTYSTSGTFLVSLIATNNNAVPIGGAAASITTFTPTIEFTANPTNGSIPFTVQFSSPGVDSGGNSITQWNWHFGDGATSTSQNPPHTYTTSGTFLVSLIATNIIGGAVIGFGPASIRATIAPVYSGSRFERRIRTGDFVGWTLSGSDTNDIIVDDRSSWNRATLWKLFAACGPVSA